MKHHILRERGRKNEGGEKEMSENKGLEDILQEIDEMIKEKKVFIDPNPISERDLYYCKGFIMACELIRDMLMRIR